jgi:hypothetical protein
MCSVTGRNPVIEGRDGGCYCAAVDQIVKKTTVPSEP